MLIQPHALVGPQRGRRSRLEASRSKAIGQGPGELANTSFNSIERVLVHGAQIHSDAHQRPIRKFRDLIERLGLLNGDARAGFFDVHAAAQQQRRPGFEHAFEPREGFRKHQRFEPPVMSCRLRMAQRSPLRERIGRKRHHHARRR